MNFNQSCLGACAPSQIVTLTMPINDMVNIGVLGANNCEYDRDNLEYSYSFDNITWSCFGSFSEIGKILLDTETDFFLKIKVQGQVNGVVEENECGEFCNVKYTTQIAEGFKFDYSAADSSNVWSPYENMEGALELQEQLNEAVSQIVGVQAYYFKLSPNVGSRDITFKEYALMDVEAVKLINVVIKDGQMPSSKPEFTEFGLDWATDWGIEITKNTFATAFGNTAQPNEGDLLYIPMMKRMWMVSSAYEEKNGSLMWRATTWTLNLVKYQEKQSVDLGSTEDMVNSFVKNKYEDLFGDQENLDSGEASVNTPINSTNNLYPIYESDATRKWITVGNIDIIKHSIYYKGTLIADHHYKFMDPKLSAKVIYQKQYCGDEGSLSFIIYPTSNMGDYEGVLLDVAGLKIMISQKGPDCSLYVYQAPNIKVDITAGQYHFVWFRWSQDMNLVEMGAAKYSWPENIPIYAVQSQHYLFDMDNLVSHTTQKYDFELIVENKGDVSLNQFYGLITNIKLFDRYNDNLSELLQQYPNHQHLLINDACRKLLDKHGPGLK